MSRTLAEVFADDTGPPGERAAFDRWIGITMNSYGIFSDEGLLEGEFSTAEEAESVRLARYAEDDARVLETCFDHPDHERTTCEECNAEEA